MGNHRADKRGRRAAVDSTPIAATGGRRKATRRAQAVPSRSPLHRPSPARPSPARPSPARPSAAVRGARFPGIPTLIGATALLIAGAGAIGMSSGALPGGSGLSLSAGASTSTGTDAYAFAGTSSRARAISRDSDRQALQAATSLNLKNEAEKQNEQRSVALTSLAKDAEHRAEEILKNQWQLPTLNYHLTARFGMTSGLWSSFHTGLDFATDTGTPIFAVANGVITSTGWDGPYGNKTVETLADGTEIWYAHQSEIDVQPGDTVTGGQTIGKVGSTGNTTGPHVHIEVRPGGGDPVDPYAAFIQHGVTP